MSPSHRTVAAAMLLAACLGSAGCGDETAGQARPSGTSQTAGPASPQVLPETVVHEGVTLYRHGLDTVRTGFVDDPAVASVRLSVGAEADAPSDCHPLPVPVVVSQDAAEVVVLVGTYSPSRRLPEQLVCAGIGYWPYQLDVALDAPLAERVLSDQQAGVVTVHAAAELPTPASVPEGFSGGRLLVDDDGVLSRAWERPDEQSLLLERRPLRAPSTLDVVAWEGTVDGQPAVATTSVGFDDSLCLRWGSAEDGANLCNLGYPEAGLDVDDLLAVAGSIPGPAPWTP